MEGREHKKKKDKQHKEKKKHKKEEHREKKRRRKRKDAEPPHATKKSPTKEAKVAGRLFAAINRCGSGQKASTTSAAALHDVRYYTARLLRLGTGAHLKIRSFCFAFF